VWPKQAAGKVFDQVINAIVSFIVDNLRKLVDPLLQLIVAAMRIQAGSVQASALYNQRELANGDPQAFGNLADIVYSGNFFNLVLALTIGIQSAWLVLLAATGGLAFAAEEALDIVTGLIIGAIVGIVITYAVDALLIGIDGFFHILIPSGDPFWAEGAGLAVMAAIVVLGRYFDNKARGEILRKTDAWWLAWAVSSVILQLVAGMLPDSLAWLEVIISAASLVFDALAVMKIVFEIDDLFDRIGGPFKYVEELTSIVTLGYDVAALNQNVGKL